MDLFSAMSMGWDTDKSATGPGPIVLVRNLEGLLVLKGNSVKLIQQNFSIHRGDDQTIEITVKNEDGNIINITDATIKFSVKERKTDTAYIIKKSTVDPLEINIVTPLNGVFEIYLVPADTQTLIPKKYVFDIELTTAAGKVYTISEGKFEIKRDLTRLDF